MMAEVLAFELKGLKQLEARLNQLSAEVAGEISRRAVADAAKIVRDSARKKAPIAEAAYIASGAEKSRINGEPVLVQPGNIPRNIIMKRKKRTAVAAQYVVTVRGKQKHGYASRIGALIEYGTINQPPRPFMAPALRENIGNATKAMARRIEQQLKKQDKKAAQK